MLGGDRIWETQGLWCGWEGDALTRLWVKVIESIWGFLAIFCKCTKSGCFFRLSVLVEISKMAFQTFSAKPAEGSVFDASFSAALPVPQCGFFKRPRNHMDI